MTIKRTKHRKLALAALLTGAALLIGCGITTLVQQTKDKENAANALDESSDDELGRCVAISITNTYPPTKNEKLIRYVNLVGFTLVQSSSKPDGHFCFGVLDTDDIGAYSGPNGYVMITRGAVESMRDEAELAGVLAHEITHIIHDDGLESARVALKKQGYTDAVTAVMHTDVLVKVADIGVDAITVNGYDKRQEDSADAGAVQLLIAAGYDPRSYAHYLSHLAAMQEAAPTANQPNEVESTYKKVMATHPGVPGRYGLVSEQIKSLGVTSGATLAGRFREHVPQ